MFYCVMCSLTAGKHCQPLKKEGGVFVAAYGINKQKVRGYSHGNRSADTAARSLYIRYLMRVIQMSKIRPEILNMRRLQGESREHNVEGDRFSVFTSHTLE